MFVLLKTKLLSGAFIAFNRKFLRMNRPVSTLPCGAFITNGGNGRPSFPVAICKPRQLMSAALPQGAGSFESALQNTYIGIAQRSGTVTSPT